MPIDRSVEPVARGDLGRERKVRSRRLVEWRDAHQPGNRQAVIVPAGAQERIRIFGQDAGLLRFGAGIDLDEQRGRASLLADFLRQRFAQARAVDRMNGVEQRHRFLRLVRLQRPDQVQRQPVVTRPDLRPFGLGLLHAILAEHPLAGCDRLFDGIGAESLGDRDQGHRGRVAVRLAAGARRSRPARRQGRRRRQRIGFGSRG